MGIYYSWRPTSYFVCNKYVCICRSIILIQLTQQKVVTKFKQIKWKQQSRKYKPNWLFLAFGKMVKTGKSETVLLFYSIPLRYHDIYQIKWTRKSS